MSMSQEQLAERVAAYPSWFYNFNLNGIETSPDTVESNRRHELRKEFFLDPLIQASAFAGKRVLDIGCCSGFWSFHALEAGAEYVLGVDAWPQAIEQAQLVADVKNISADRCEFRLEDIFTLLSQQELSDSFDIVLCLGFLYHIKRPIELLEHIYRVSRDLLILDTTVYDNDDAVISLRPDAGKQSYVESARDRLAFVPSEKALHWMMKEVGFQCRTIQHAFSSDDKGVADYINGERMVFACSKLTDVSSIYSDLKDKPDDAPATLLEFLEEYHQNKHNEAQEMRRLKEAQQLVREREARELELDVALKEAQQLVREREARELELDVALKEAQQYVRDREKDISVLNAQREKDISVLNAQVEGLKYLIDRIEKHWLLGFMSKIFIGSRD